MKKIMLNGHISFEWGCNDSSSDWSISYPITWVIDGILIKLLDDYNGFPSVELEVFLHIEMPAGH